jgi:hypothetical protein
MAMVVSFSTGGFQGDDFCGKRRGAVVLFRMSSCNHGRRLNALARCGRRWLRGIGHVYSTPPVPFHLCSRLRKGHVEQQSTAGVGLAHGQRGEGNKQSHQKVAHGAKVLAAE